MKPNQYYLRIVYIINAILCLPFPMLDTYYKKPKFVKLLYNLYNIMVHVLEILFLIHGCVMGTKAHTPFGYVVFLTITATICSILMQEIIYVFLRKRIENYLRSFDELTEELVKAPVGETLSFKTSFDHVARTPKIIMICVHLQTMLAVTSYLVPDFIQVFTEENLDLRSLRQYNFDYFTSKPGILLMATYLFVTTYYVLLKTNSINDTLMFFLTAESALVLHMNKLLNEMFKQTEIDKNSLVSDFAEVGFHSDGKLVYKQIHQSLPDRQKMKWWIVTHQKVLGLCEELNEIIGPVIGVSFFASLIELATFGILMLGSSPFDTTERVLKLIIFVGYFLRIAVFCNEAEKLQNLHAATAEGLFVEETSTGLYKHELIIIHQRCLKQINLSILHIFRTNNEMLAAFVKIAYTFMTALVQIDSNSSKNKN